MSASAWTSRAPPRTCGGSVGQGAAFQCRLDRTSREGPRRAPCRKLWPGSASALDVEPLPFYYDIVMQNPLDAGTYDLAVLWIRVSQGGVRPS